MGVGAHLSCQFLKETETGDSGVHGHNEQLRETASKFKRVEP